MREWIQTIPCPLCLRPYQSFKQFGFTENSLDNVFFGHHFILQFPELIQWFYYRGEEGSNFFQGVGVSKETHITCGFPEGGSRPPNPPLDPHVGSPDATVCLQNHGLSKFK